MGRKPGVKHLCDNETKSFDSIKQFGITVHFAWVLAVDLAIIVVYVSCHILSFIYLSVVALVQTDCIDIQPYYINYDCLYCDINVNDKGYEIYIYTQSYYTKCKITVCQIYIHTLRKDFVMLQLYWWLLSSTKHSSWNNV